MFTYLPTFLIFLKKYPIEMKRGFEPKTNSSEPQVLQTYKTLY